MARKVFISYRREDSAPYAGRIHDRVERELGRDRVFMDVDSTPLGINFAKLLREEVAKCGVLLAVIGPHWLDGRDEDGTRRLENPTDYVRIEIAAALQREIPVIPILVDGARVPNADQLPDDLQELALRNGLNVRHDSFRPDMDKLVDGLKGQDALEERLSAAQALYDKGVGRSALATLVGYRVYNTADDVIAAIEIFEDVLERIGTATELPLRELAAEALLEKAELLAYCAGFDQGIAAYDDLLARIGTATELPLRELAAKALMKRALALRTAASADRQPERTATPSR